MKLICISGLHRYVLITFSVDSVFRSDKRTLRNKRGGSRCSPPALVPVLSISKTFLMGHPKVTNFYSCNVIFDVIFSVADPLFLQLSWTQGCLCRSHPIKTHVWTLIIIREFGIRKVKKKLVISPVFCIFIVGNQNITKRTSDDYQGQSYRDFLYYWWIW